MATLGVNPVSRFQTLEFRAVNLFPGDSFRRIPLFGFFRVYLPDCRTDISKRHEGGNTQYSESFSK